MIEHTPNSTAGDPDIRPARMFTVTVSSTNLKSEVKQVLPHEVTYIVGILLATNIYMRENLRIDVEEAL